MLEAQSSQSTSSRVLKVPKCKNCGDFKDVDCKMSNLEKNVEKLYWSCTSYGGYVRFVKDHEVKRCGHVSYQQRSNSASVLEIE